MSCVVDGQRDVLTDEDVAQRVDDRCRYIKRLCPCVNLFDMRLKICERGHGLRKMTLVNLEI